MPYKARFSGCKGNFIFLNSWRKSGKVMGKGGAGDYSVAASGCLF